MGGAGGVAPPGPHGDAGLGAAGRPAGDFALQNYICGEKWLVHFRPEICPLYFSAAMAAVPGGVLPVALYEGQLGPHAGPRAAT